MALAKPQQNRRIVLATPYSTKVVTLASRAVNHELPSLPFTDYAHVNLNGLLYDKNHLTGGPPLPPAFFRACFRLESEPTLFIKCN